MKKIFLWLGFSMIMNTGCAIFGIRTAKEPKFKTIKEEGPMQIREYDSFMIVRSKENGEAMDDTSNSNFRKLFNYISGNNTSKEKIEMTAPVLSEQTSQKIEMTAPVFLDQNEASWVMSFVLPARFNKDNTPKPLDDTLEVVFVPQQTVAVLRYSGSRREKRAKNEIPKLKVWIEKLGYKPLGRHRFAFYDPPFTITFLRRNEIHIEVEKD